MFSQISPILAPNKVIYRLTSVGTRSNFALNRSGIWAFTVIGGGAGSGATHTSYAAPSEHGYNGALGNFTYAWVTKIASAPIVGQKGLGGTATNDSNVTAQRGKPGQASHSGTTSRNGGNGGKCAFEQVGLSPTQPAAIYPTTTYDNRSVAGGAFLGVLHDGGSVTNSAGRGAGGKTAPGVDGDDGIDGRVDWYNSNGWT